MNRKWIALAGIVLLLSSLACSTEVLRERLEARAQAAGQTVVAKGEAMALTKAAELFLTARAEVAGAAPEVRQTIQARLQTQAPALARTAQAAVLTPGQATEGANLLETAQVAAEGQLILIRAYDWLDGQIRYDPAANLQGYRCDPAGFAAFAWHLTEGGAERSPDPAALGLLWAQPITYEQLAPGDILNNQRADETGHVVLFERWLNEEHTRFNAYELNRLAGLTVETQLTLVPVAGGYTIQEYESALPGPYYPQRKP
jgi:hypothetical protein